MLFVKINTYFSPLKFTQSKCLREAFQVYFYSFICLNVSSIQYSFKQNVYSCFPPLQLTWQLALTWCIIAVFPLQQSAERCVSTLLDLIQTKVNYVVQEAIVVIRDIFRKYPNKYAANTLVVQLSRCRGGVSCWHWDPVCPAGTRASSPPSARTLTHWMSLTPALPWSGSLASTPSGSTMQTSCWRASWRASMTRAHRWIVALHRCAVYLFDSPTQLKTCCFVMFSMFIWQQVQLTLLTAIVKLFLKKPSETQELVQQVLSLATQVRLLE